MNIKRTKPATKTSPKTNAFPDHADQLRRVARIKGQIDGVARMIVEQRYCVEILTQTAAIRAALKSLEANVLERHIGSCVTHALKSGIESDEKIAELLKLYKNA
jgi:CsoR family transcriptional regulator, copper-sensing transcriptional repressor